ncbi:MAG: PLP-dependent aminotransferase family protein [Salinarimonas sp.]|nr:PLP-dependent aminotransferase family protein [Salinarimonas sp.]
MKLPSPWTPRLAPPPGLAHERLTAALAEDILCGTIPPGARLPAHRDLAQRLDISLGTVTRAYETLQRRGLARGEKGRGMFVTQTAPVEGRRIDLSVNLPPPVLTAPMLKALLGRVAEKVDAQHFNAYEAPAGQPGHRTLLARKLADERGLDFDPGRLFLTSGAQHALFIALAAAPPGPVAIEEVTYPGALRAARMLGRELIPLAMDAQGVTPDALRAALARPDPPRLAYLMPSMQNPTGALMQETRRREIAALARQADLALIEDDVYAVFAPADLPALAQLAPERTFYVGSLSKSLSPGLRTGYLFAPGWAGEACNHWLQATRSMADPLSGLLMELGLGEGLDKSVAQSIRAEAQRRCRAARQHLGPWLAPQAVDGLHVWLPLPTARARDIVLAAARRDIHLAPPEAFMADPQAQHAGLRICLGNAGAEQLTAALSILAQLLTESGEAGLGLFPAV